MRIFSSLITDIFIYTPCTSPFVKPETVSVCIKKFLEDNGEHDCVSKVSNKSKFQEKKILNLNLKPGFGSSGVADHLRQVRQFLSQQVHSFGRMHVAVSQHRGTRELEGIALNKTPVFSHEVGGHPWRDGKFKL